MNLADDVRTVRTEGPSTDGLPIGKHLSREKFEKSLPLGPALSDLAFGYDIGGLPYMGWWDEWRTGCLGDIHQRPDLDTLVGVRPGLAACIADHVHVDGRPLEICPRSVLKSVISRLANHGFTARASFEVEGMVFAESFAEARAKSFRSLTPLGIAPPIGYSTHDAHRIHEFMDEVVRRLDVMGVEWEAWNAEAAPAQFEINITGPDALSATDAAFRARAVVRDVAHDLGRSITFMAKPSEEYGNGMHIHHSLLRDGVPVFYDDAEPDGRSKVMRHWIGGLMATMDAAHSFLTPTLNSYRRMVNYAAAPVVASWAEDNKSTALRTISRSAKVARVEHRVGAADLNPYLAMAAVLAGGIIGLEQAVEPPAELQLLAWGLPSRFPHLPRSIVASAEALEQQKGFIDILGPQMVNHWVQTRRWEWMMYHTTGGDAAAESVTDWELNRYFELI